MAKSIKERIQYITKKVARETKVYNEMKTDIKNIQQWIKKNPTKTELRVPYMGLVNPTVQLKQAKSNLKKQKNGLDRYKDQLKRLKARK